MEVSLREKYLFEKMPVFKAIMKLAFPSVMGQIILVLYNMADTFFIGTTGSDSMLTAITVCMPAFMFLSAISNLFGIGGASVISRALGKKNEPLAKNASAYAFWGCIFVTSVYCIGVFAFKDQFINLLGGINSEVHNFSTEYLIIVVVAGGLITALNTLFSHLLRAEGKSILASIGIISGGLLNIFLDPLFIFVVLPTGQEVLGVAIATLISNTIALIYYVVVISVLHKKLHLSVIPTKSMFKDDIPKKVFIVGLPACIMTLCENISYAILDKLMAIYGVGAQAGIGVAKKINMLAHSIVRGMTQGVLPLIGYNYASGKKQRVKSVFNLSCAISISISLICLVVNVIFSKELIGMFIQKTGESLDFGSIFLKILCIGAPFSAFAYSVISFFQATGRGIKSLILALLRKGILDIPLMFILNIAFAQYGIVWATPIADACCCIIAIVLFVNFMHKNGYYKDNLPPKTPDEMQPQEI